MPRRTDAPPPDWSWLAVWPDQYQIPGDEMAPEVMAGWYQLRYDLAIVVYGRPAPQGSKRHVGKGVMVESSAHLKPWREAVRSEAAAKLGVILNEMGVALGPMTCPVAARMIFTMPCPKSARPGDRPAVMPDASKLVRSTEDALVDAGVLADDKLIVEYDRVAKVYPRWDPESLDRPGAVIRLRRLA